MRYDEILIIDVLKDTTHPNNDKLVNDVAEFFNTSGMQNLVLGIYLDPIPGQAREDKVQKLLKELKEKNPSAIREMCGVIKKMGVPCGHLFNVWLRQRDETAANKR